MDFENLIRADSVAGFLESIRASIYYEPLEALYKNGDAVIFDYELCIDLLYFKTVWKIKDRLVSKINRRLMEAFFGTRLDLLNLQWIYRSKKYYSLSQAQLYSMLIPDYYKLKESEIKRLYRFIRHGFLIYALDSSESGDFIFARREIGRASCRERV